MGFALAALVGLALALRLTIRDRLPLFATLFYATPLPILVLLLAAAGACWWQRRSVFPFVGAAILCGWMMWPAARTPLEGGGDVLRLVLWNVAHRGDATRTRAALASMNADVVVLVETGGVSPAAIEAWAWPAAVATGGMLVLAKDAVLDEGRIDVGRSARARRFAVVSGGTSLRLVVADVRSHPFVSREPSLRTLQHEADAIDGTLILLGDFNTPAESVWFDGYRESFTNAFESVGRGWAATWPSPLPVLHVDHVWTRGVTPVRAEHGWVRGFDHRPVIVDLAPER